MLSYMISQTLLAKYHDLAELERQVKEKRLKLREKLKRLLRAGAVVQAGRFTPLLSEYQERALTKCAIIDALGEEEYEWLREQVTPVDRVAFRVLDSKAKQKKQKKSINAAG